MHGRKCAAWEGQKAGAKGNGSERALWEPEPEASLITSWHHCVSCPLPEGQRSPRLTKHQEPSAEQCQASGDPSLVCPKVCRREGSLLQGWCVCEDFGHSWDFKMPLKSLGKLKIPTPYWT